MSLCKGTDSTTDYKKFVFITINMSACAIVMWTKILPKYQWYPALVFWLFGKLEYEHWLFRSQKSIYIKSIFWKVVKLVAIQGSLLSLLINCTVQLIIKSLQHAQLIVGHRININSGGDKLALYATTIFIQNMISNHQLWV